MEYLPLELKEKILLHADPKEVLSLCSTSIEFLSLCSSAVFWREKFAKENIPLLEEGVTASEWLHIYSRSLEAIQQANRFLANIERGKKGKVEFTDLARLENIDFLRLPGIYFPFIERLWKETQKAEELAPYDREASEFLLNSPYLVISKSPESFYVDVYYPLMGLTEDRSFPQTKEEIWELLYRLSYFTYILMV